MSASASASARRTFEQERHPSTIRFTAEQESRIKRMSWPELIDDDIGKGLLFMMLEGRNT